MRRGRGLFLIAACALAVTCGFATAARADDSGGSAMAICTDLQDGKLDGTYTQDQWNAFQADPTVQGYCNVIVPPCAYPGSGGSGSGGTTCQTTTPPTQPQPTGPVALTPQPAMVVRVKAARATVVKSATPRRSAVKGTQHTATPQRAAAAPLTTTRRTGTLPFTGAQLIVFTLVGLGLVAAGLVLRGTGRRRFET
jgi:hypothetical protein